MSSEVEYEVDRSDWPSGPWDGEPDKMQWRTEAGLPGLIVRSPFGGLCGYVGVPNGHPLYGCRSADEPAACLSAHGGVNYSAPCGGAVCHVPEPDESDDVWWFGFDCNHAFDYAPGLHRHRMPAPRYGVYRDVSYVRGEVEDLARQIAELAELAP